MKSYDGRMHLENAVVSNPLESCSHYSNFTLEKIRFGPYHGKARLLWLERKQCLSSL